MDLDAGMVRKLLGRFSKDELLRIYPSELLIALTLPSSGGGSGDVLRKELSSANRAGGSGLGTGGGGKGKGKGKGKAKRAASAASNDGEYSASADESSDASGGDDDDGKHPNAAAKRSRVLPLLTEQQLSKMTKSQLIDTIVTLQHKNGMSANQVAHIDMLYYKQMKPARIVWTAYKVTPKEPAASGQSSDEPEDVFDAFLGRAASEADSELVSRNKSVLDPDAFHAALKKRLSLFFQTHIYVKTFGNAVWARISLQDGDMRVLASTLPTITSTLFMVYFGHSSLLVLSQFRPQFQEYITQSLSAVLNCHSLSATSLSGNNVDTIAALYLHQQSQGGMDTYLYNEADENPLNRRRRKVSSEAPAAFKSANSIVVEDDEDAGERKRVAVEKFGHHAPPVLRRVQFSLETKFHGRAIDIPSAHALARPLFPCKVTLEGPSILQGLKSLITTGIAARELPPYVANLPSLAASKITVTDGESEGVLQGKPAVGAPGRRG